jgi:hypothetical protein
MHRALAPWHNTQSKAATLRCNHAHFGSSSPSRRCRLPSGIGLQDGYEKCAALRAVLEAEIRGRKAADVQLEAAWKQGLKDGEQLLAALDAAVKANNELEDARRRHLGVNGELLAALQKALDTNEELRAEKEAAAAAQQQVRKAQPTSRVDMPAPVHGVHPYTSA